MTADLTFFLFLGCSPPPPFCVILPRRRVCPPYSTEFYTFSLYRMEKYDSDVSAGDCKYVLNVQVCMYYVSLLKVL